MYKNQVFPYYNKCCNELSRVYKYMQSLYADDCVSELAQLRGYTDGEQVNLLRQLNIGYCDIQDVEDLGVMRKELGLVSAKDNFMLSDRFIIPIEDLTGNLVALVGYYKDAKRYVTTPSPFFSKECMFFNYRQAYELAWSEYNGFVILVEGLFDCLSLRSIGLPAIATMGASVSKTKGVLLNCFSKVLGIPDDDATGRQSLDRYTAKGWHVPSNTTMLRFHGGMVDFGNGNKLHCKDMDNLVSWFDANDVREMLLSFRDSKEDIEDLYL